MPPWGWSRTQREGFRENLVANRAAGRVEQGKLIILKCFNFSIIHLFPSFPFFVEGDDNMLVCKIATLNKIRLSFITYQHYSISFMKEGIKSTLNSMRVEARIFFSFFHVTYAPPEGAGGWCDPLAVWPLIELELRGNNGRVGRYEMQRFIQKCKVSGQPVTPQVRSMT